MALTPEQEKQLAELQAEQNKPDPRTESGLAGILHTVLDVVAGDVAHLPADAWAALHRQVEDVAGEKQPEQPAADDGQAAADSSSSGKSSPSSPGKGSKS